MQALSIPWRAHVRWLAFVAAILAAGLQPVSSPAAGHDQEALDKLNQKFRSKWGPLQTKGKIESAEDKEVFDSFVNYRIAELTWPEMRAPKDKPLGTLSKRREGLKTTLGSLSRAQAPDLHRLLNQTLLERLAAEARDDNNPIAARLNCVFMLAMLDETELAAQQSAVPLPGVLPILLETAGKADEHEALRIAALVGIERHSLAAADAGRVAVPVLIKVATTKKPAARSTADGHLWLRMRAVNLLDGLAKSGLAEANAPEAVAAVIDVTTETGGDRWLRAEAAAALGSLDSKVIPPAMIPKLVDALGRLAADSTVRHADLIKRSIPAPPPSEQPQVTDEEASEDDDAESDEEKSTEPEPEAPSAAPSEARIILARQALDELIKIRLGMVGVPPATKKPSSRKKEDENPKSKAELIGPAADHGVYAAAGDDSTKEYVLDVVLRIDELIDELRSNKDDDVSFVQFLETAGDGLKGLLDSRKLADEPTKSEGGAKESKARPMATGRRGGAGASESTVSE